MAERESSSIARRRARWTAPAARYTTGGDGQPPTAAVLVRRNADAGPIAAELTARGIPVEVVGLSGLLSIPEVAQVLSTLRLVADPSAGAAAMGLISLVKSRFVAFPLHPIGMALGLTHPVYQVWFSVFIAWLLKAVILKYGGARLYLRLRPLFLGVVLGAFGSAGVWLVIDGITGMAGNVFTLG